MLASPVSEDAVGQVTLNQVAAVSAVTQFHTFLGHYFRRNYA
jgi:hypothetical protein